MIAVSLIVVGAILIITGVVVFPKQHKVPDIPVVSDGMRLEVAIDTAIADGVLTANEKNALRKIAQDNLSDADLAVKQAENRLTERKLKPETEMIDPNKKSGNDFEKYIVKKFNRKNYRIKEWAGDKYVEGRYAETTPQPDLLMELKAKGINYLFAVECKWRKNDWDKGFNFDSDAQFERYKKYEEEKGIPVFIAIGYGGEGDDPEQLFVVPLRFIKSNFIGKDLMMKFEKEKDRSFFYNHEKQFLNSSAAD